MKISDNLEFRFLLFGLSWECTMYVGHIFAIAYMLIDRF